MRRFALPKSWILAVVLAAVAGSPALAQNYPSRAIRTIVPYQAGTGGDIAARYVADALGKSLGQSFFVEIASVQTATSAPPLRPRRHPTDTRCSPVRRHCR